ncbi:MAG: hypothetical protein NTW19_09160 [Planctomycetota bacterium]|nr:hypothetical protein [Planctomycetota bacterium]
MTTKPSPSTAAAPDRPEASGAGTPSAPQSPAGAAGWVPGVTPVSLVAGFFAMLAMAILIQVADVVLGITFTSEQSLALQAIWVIVFLSMVSGAVYAVLRVRLLSRAEMLCILFAMLIGAPLMTQGFWHRIVAVIATIPRTADFEKADAYNDKLWPHGPNLAEAALDKSNLAKLVFEGRTSWEALADDKGRTRELPTLRNAGKGDVSFVRVRLAVDPAGKSGVTPGEPYLVSVLARASDLGSEAHFHARLHVGDDKPALDLFTSTAAARKSFIHPAGFVRVGAYGLRMPADVVDHVDLELGLTGIGSVAFDDLKLISVGALEGVYKGRKVVSHAEFDQLPPGERTGLLVRPDSPWSLEGAAFMLSGYIPVADWLAPILGWTIIILLLLTGTLAVGVLVRRQWLDNERFTMPMTRIPLALLDDSESPGRALPPIWRNKIMWTGFAVSLAWMLMKAWNHYDPRVPNMAIEFQLTDFLSDPGWGTMFQRCRFEVNAIFLAICCFMELNVLLSLVLGYWLFRSQGWVGEFTGWKANPGFPYQHEQAIAAYVVYAAVTLFFMRGYVGKILQAAWRNDKAASAGEAMSYRAAILVILACMVGCAGWAHWMGIGVGGMLVYMAFLLVVGFVSAKIRTECGLPWGYFAPQNLALFMALVGGVPVLGAEAMLFCFISSFCLAPTVFFLIPGAQLEMLELGRRWRVRPSHVVVSCFLGALGGMVVGGWVFLSNAYVLGGETMRYEWAFATKSWYFFVYNQQLQDATAQMPGVAAVAPAAASAAKGITAQTWACLYGGLGTLVLALVRQFFAGSWFHPVGFVLGCTNFMDYVWGSALAGLVIRAAVLWTGGAATVRNKLQPFFVGVFLGAALAELLIGGHGAYLQSIGVQKIFPTLRPA